MRGLLDPPFATGRSTLSSTAKPYCSLEVVSNFEGFCPGGTRCSFKPSDFLALDGDDLRSLPLGMIRTNRSTNTDANTYSTHNPEFGCRSAHRITDVVRFIIAFTFAMPSFGNATQHANSAA